jgi:hypothetical protein
MSLLILFNQTGDAGGVAPFNSSPQVAAQRPIYSAASQVLGSSMALLAAVVVAVPFNQTSWPAAHSIGGLPGLSDQGIWSLTIPFAQYDWSAPFRPLPSVPRAEGVNIALTAQVVAAPFSQTNWPGALGPRYFRPAQVDGAIIDISQPFAQLDWSKPQPFAPATPPLVTRNVNIFSEIPFAQYDWSKTKGIASKASDVYQPWQNFYSVVVTAPFYQSSWPSVQSVRSASPRAPDQSYPNLPMLFAMPFFPVDGSRVRPASIPAPAAQSYNLALLGVVPAPFVPIDWSKPFFPRIAAAVVPSLNTNLFQNPLPFVTTDRPKIPRVPLVAPPQLLPLNLNLFKNLLPFAQYGWPSAFDTPVPQPQLQPYNINIFSSSGATVPTIRQLVSGSGDKATIFGGGVKMTITGSSDKAKIDGKPY